MKNLLVVLVLFALLGASSAYYCWVCESTEYYDGASCADPFFKGDSTLAKRQCSGDCYKEITTYSDGSKKYKRGCDTCTKDCSTVGTARTCRECCYGQLCNSSDRVAFNRVALVLAPLLAIVYYIF